MTRFRSIAIPVALTACLPACLLLMVAAAPATARTKPTAVRAPVQAPSIAGPNDQGIFAAPKGPRYRSGELVVRFKPGVTAEQKSSAHGRRGAKVVKSMLLPRTELVSFDKSRNVHALVRAYEREGTVQYAEPNFVYHLDSAFPDDPHFAEQWPLNNRGQVVNGAPGIGDEDIDAPEAWERTAGNPAVVVGVVDSGISHTNPDLAPNIWTNPGELGNDEDGNGLVGDVRGWDFLCTPQATCGSQPLDDQGHGTHMAGIIGAAGNNGLGIAGVSWNVRLASLRVCSPDPFIGCESQAIADAFYYAESKGMRIVNASLSGPLPSLAISDAINLSTNTLFVVSAGNGGNDVVGDDVDSTPQYPCADTAPNLICVAATDQNGERAGFSDYGANSVDLGAPGTNALSHWLGNQLAFLGGTSPATAEVSGVAALIHAASPNSPSGLKSQILGSVVSEPTLAGKTVSGGVLNAAGAVPAPPSTPGDSEPRFGGGGVVTNVRAQDSGNAVAKTSSGKIVVAGSTDSGANTDDFLILRYNPDGTLDSSFGNGGIVITDFGSVDRANAVTIDGSGKIVAAGTTCVGASCNPAAARYNTSGTLDTSFDLDGKWTADVGPNDQVTAVASQSDGKIVVAGSVQNATRDTAVARLNNDGTPDTSFAAGTAMTDFGGDDSAFGLQIQSDGKIVVSGARALGSTTADFTLGRYIGTTGALDTSFDGDGKVTTNLTGSRDEARALAIQSDGKLIAAGLSVQNTPGKIAFATNRDGNEETYTVEPNGTDLTRLTNNAAGDGFLAWSPNGTKIAFGTVRDGNEEIYSMNADGTAQTRLTNNAAIDTRPTWSGDGSKIAFHSTRDGNDEIYVMNSDGTAQTRITANAASDREPTWSVNDKIAFTSTRDGNTEIYVMDSSGANQARLTNDPAADERPDWSPDGSQIAFQSSRTGTSQIHKMKYDGTAVTNLTGIQGGFDPAWSPDGSALVFATQRDGNFEVYRMLADGSSLVRMTANAALDHAPDWGPGFSHDQMGLTRYNSNGSLDAGFDGDGKQFVLIPNAAAEAHALAITPAQLSGPGKIVVAGREGSGNFAVARFKTGGTIDTGFGSGGTLTAHLSAGEGTDEGNGVVIDDNGTIVVGGTADVDIGALSIVGGAPKITVSPNTGLDTGGQPVTITGSGFDAAPTVQVVQCRDGACPDGSTVAPDSSGAFSITFPVSYSSSPIFSSCEDPHCRILAFPSAGSQQATTPISFKSPSSTVGAPSGGLISQAQSLTLGQSVTDGAVVQGRMVGGTPTGSVSFSVCGPVASPATCAAGTPVAGGSSSAGPNNTLLATSGSFTPGSVGRYCFRAAYSGSDLYQSSSDSGTNQCIWVNQPTAAIVGTDDYYRLTADTTSFIVPAPGVLQNDLRPEGQTLNATLMVGPANGDLVGGLQPNGAFTYVPDFGFTGRDEFKYQAQGTSGTSTANVLIDVTAANDTSANRSRANRSRANRSRVLDLAQVVTYADCRSRYVSVNPQVMLSEDTLIQLSAALYNASGQRIATPDGYLAYGEFFADFANPLTLAWPSWAEPAPPGGAYVEVLLEANSDIPADAYTVTATVPCRT